MLHASRGACFECHRCDEFLKPIFQLQTAVNTGVTCPVPQSMPADSRSNDAKATSTCRRTRWRCFVKTLASMRDACWQHAVCSLFIAAAAHTCSLICMSSTCGCRTNPGCHCRCATHLGGYDVRSLCWQPLLVSLLKEKGATERHVTKATARDRTRTKPVRPPDPGQHIRTLIQRYSDPHLWGFCRHF